MTGQSQLLQRRKRNAERQRELRDERDANGQCRACGRPVTTSKKTGKPARMCKRHLGGDAKRKARERRPDVYVLPLQCLEAKAGRKFELEFPLDEPL